jgi:CBS domain containing-hemolysin-like protein
MNYLFIIAISVLFSAFFSGMEIAFIASNKLRIELEKKQRTFNSRILSVFTRNPGQYVVTMLIGNNIALVIFGIVMAIILEPLIVRFTSSDISILIIQTIISTLIILFFAEFLPKALFRINPNGFLTLFSLPVLFFYMIFYPVSKITISLSHFILRTFFNIKISGKPENKVFHKVDLDHLVSEGQVTRDAEDEEALNIKIFQNALDFSNIKLRECMIPRTEIIALEKNSSIDELRQTFIDTGLSKILIYRDSIDNIIGYANLKDLFKNPKSIESKLVKVSMVPETMPANKLLELFVEEKKNIAVVVDEFGGTSGMVTIEDILEEIFGEIEDEHDSSELVEKQISEHEFLLSGRLEIDYLNEKYKLEIPEKDDYETLAGFILYQHESIPNLNQLIKIDHFIFKIMRVSETKVELVNLKLAAKN